MSTKTILAAALCAAALQVTAAPAWAGKTIPFTLTTALTFNGGSGLECVGPWGRTSGCFGEINNNQRYNKFNFYSAEETIFSPYGHWSCRTPCFGDNPAKVRFCLKDNNPTQVDLRLSESGTLTANAGDPECKSAKATSTLGQDGEDAETAQDVDVFDFPGKAGEQVAIVLDQDGSGGGTDGPATLRVLAGGNTLAQRTGELPIKLDVTLAGPVAIHVQRAAAAKAFRGFYSLEVAPEGSAIGQRLLRPKPNVEE